MNELTDFEVQQKSWRRFTLRSFLIACTAFALILGQFIIRAQRQKKTVDWCLNQGGSVVYDFDYDQRRHDFRKQIPSESAWYENETLQDYFSNVVRVDLTSNNSDLSPLANLKQLDRLAIRDTNSSDLAILDNFDKLKVLHISGDQITDLSPLSRLPSLEQLGLTKISASNLEPLAQLKKLEFLSISDCLTVDLEPLTQLKDLKVLVIQNTSVNDAEIKKIKDAFPSCVVQVFNRPAVRRK